MPIQITNPHLKLLSQQYLVLIRHCLILFIVLHSFTQLRAQVPMETSVSWQLFDNRIENGKSTSQFIIRNNAEKAVAKSGWSLWFSSMRSIDVKSVKPPYLLSRENGDLYRLSFTDGFAGIAPADSILIPFSFISRIINFSDAPAGLYIAYDDPKIPSQAIGNYTVLPYKKNQKEQLKVLSAQYDLNQKLEAMANSAKLRIIPEPVALKQNAGSFILSTNTSLSADQRFKKEAEGLDLLLEKLIGKRLLSNVPNQSSQINIVYQAGLENEAYTLESTEQHIVIKASTSIGAFYGVQTLRSLFPPAIWADNTSSFSLPLVQINDKPRFGYRGFMLDVARNFHSKEEVFKILDVMASYKLNVFHIHLTDDEGWRIAIPALPELTEVGSKRSADFKNGLSIQPSYGSGAKTTEKQFFTENDFIEILKYADERHITVIPELETPGHARAAIKSMDARYNSLIKLGKKKEAGEFLLRDLGDKSAYRSAQDWNDNVMNVALPSTFHFIETVLDAFVNMYEKAGLTLKRVHLGADEVPRGAWEKSPAIIQLMDSLSMGSVNEVWPYYVNQLKTIFNKKGLQLAGWEEMGMVNDGKGMKPNPRFANDNIQLDVWNNVAGGGAEDLVYKLANQGYPVIYTSANNFYLDQAWNDTYLEPGHTWAAYINLEQSFSFMPTNYFRNLKSTSKGVPLKAGYFNSKERLTEKGKANIIGLKGALWSEKINNDNRLEYMLLPRLLAVAEKAWAPEPQWEKEEEKNWSELYNKAWLEFAYQVNRNEFQKLDYLGGGFAYRIPDVGIKVIDNKIVCNTASPLWSIYYTTDGSEPSMESNKYTGPIANSPSVKIKAFSKNGRGGKTVSIN